MKLIDKGALVAELKKRISDYWSDSENTMGIYPYALEEVIKYVDTLEVKGVDLEDTIDEAKDEAMRDIAWKVHVMISKGKSISEIDHYVCGICDF